MPVEYKSHADRANHPFYAVQGDFQPMQVKIKGYTFTLAAPYSEGHRLTAGEAQALNNLRAENVQNNFRSFVNDQVTKFGLGVLLPQAVLAALQLQLSNYDAGYTFAEKSGRSRTGDIEREARAIAADRVAAQLHAAGTADIAAEALNKLIDEMAVLPAVVEEARLRVAANRSALAGGMDSL